MYGLYIYNWFGILILKVCFSEETMMFAVENLFARDFIAMNTKEISECSQNNSLLFETGIWLR